MLTTVIVVLLSETFPRSKSIPGFSSDGIKRTSEGKKEGRKKKTEIWFCRIFSNIGSSSGPILWLHLCPRECFPCQHTSLPCCWSLLELWVSVVCAQAGPGSAFNQCCWAGSCMVHTAGTESKMTPSASAHCNHIVIEMLLAGWWVRHPPTPWWAEAAVGGDKHFQWPSGSLRSPKCLCNHLCNDKHFYHVLLLCLCCMGACYDWIGLTAGEGPALGLFQGRQHFKYSISSRFIVTGFGNV